MDMFVTCIVVIFSRMYAYVQTYQIVYLKYVQIFVYQLHLNQAVKSFLSPKVPYLCHLSWPSYVNSTPTLLHTLQPVFFLFLALVTAQHCVISLIVYLASISLPTVISVAGGPTFVQWCIPFTLLSTWCGIQDSLNTYLLNKWINSIKNTPNIKVIWGGKISNNPYATRNQTVFHWI